MDRRDVKLFLLVARRRREQQQATLGESFPSTIESKRHQPSPFTHNNDAEEEDDDDNEDEIQPVEAARRLVSLEDMIMFKLCMQYV